MQSSLRGTIVVPSPSLRGLGLDELSLHDLSVMFFVCSFCLYLFVDSVSSRSSIDDEGELFVTTPLHTASRIFKDDVNSHCDLVDLGVVWIMLSASKTIWGLLL